MSSIRGTNRKDISLQVSCQIYILSICLSARSFANIVVANQDGSDSLFQFHPQGFSNPINYGPLSNLEPFLFFYSMYHVRDPFFSQATTIIQLTLWVSAAPAQYHKNNDCANPIYNCRFFSSNTHCSILFLYTIYIPKTNYFGVKIQTIWNVLLCLSKIFKLIFFFPWDLHDFGAKNSHWFLLLLEILNFRAKTFPNLSIWKIFRYKQHFYISCPLILAWKFKKSHSFWKSWIFAPKIFNFH